MARVLTCGFELNSLTQGMEIFPTGATGTIVTSPVNNSTYSLRINPSAAAQYVNMGLSLTSVKTAFFRFHFYATTMPPADALVFSVMQSDLTTIMMRLRGTGSGLKVMNAPNSQVGSSIALSTGQWYLIEIKCFSNASTGTIDVKVDGSTVVSGTSLNTGGGDISGLQIGSGAATTSEYYVDNLAVNDTSGSYQNDWIGDGYIIALRPNAAGDSTNYTRGGADSGANWSQCDEVTPNDITDYVVSTTTNHVDMYNVGASGIGSGDTVNVVHVGSRIANITADGSARFQVQAIKTTGGTVASGTDLTALSGTTWRSNNTPTTGFNPYELTMYVDPDSAAWTQSTLDTMQIGFKATVGGPNGVACSAVWAMVDYTPAAAPSFNAAWNTSANATIQPGAMHG